MKNKRVAIVTPVHNRRDLTLQCLQSLSRIDRTGLDVHIIVVDDGSTDGTSEAIRRKFPEVEIVQGDGNLWYTAGTNLGIETALKNDPDYVLGINDDSIFDQQFLQRMVECAEKNPRSVVGGLLLLWDVPHKVFQVSPKWNWRSGGWRYWMEQTVWTVPKKPWAVEMIVGNCILYPVQVFAENGLMNPSKLAQYGDAEFTPRIRRNGWQLLIEPRARVFCQPNYAPKKVLRLPLKEKINLLFFQKKSAHNLIHRFHFYTISAPSKLEGFAAYWIFFIRWMWEKLFRRAKSPEKPEPKLATVFAHSVVKD